MGNARASASSAADWKAAWCWASQRPPRLWNDYVYFRRVIDLPSTPQQAIVRVSADARYILYVNGQRVHQGPARSYARNQSFDQLDLTDLLHAGKNTICAIGHQFGIPTFQSIYVSHSGFILDGEIELEGTSIPIHTPTDWVSRRASGWRKDVVRLSIQLGFQEHFDADADPPDWMSPDFVADEAGGWRMPEVAGPAGCHPWLNMSPRGVPLLADHVENFASVLAQFRGENLRGYKITDNVYHVARQEERKADKNLLENPAAMLTDNSEVTTVAPPADGEFVMAVLDLATYRSGHLILDIAEAAGDEIIDIIYTENVDKTNAPAYMPATTHCAEVTADRYRCRPGAQRWEPFHFMGMRYATLIFRNVSQPLKMRYVGLRQVHATLDFAGKFECSDARLNQIWEIARTTQLNCAFDSFVDCPWREQAQWWGDARVQARVTAYAFGDTTLLARGIRQMAESQEIDGSLHSHPPSNYPRHRLPDFMITWVATLWDHNQLTASTDLLRECLPTMHRLFEFFAEHELQDGLIGNFGSGWWLFLDWQELYKQNFSAVFNMMYLQSLRHAALICQRLGDESAASRYAAKAAALTLTLEKYFWDAKAKVWRDGFDAAENEPVEQVSQHANALAILLDLKPETHEAIAREVLLKSARSKRTKILTGSPFFYAYILEAIGKTGLRKEMIDLMRDKWGEMIDAGAVAFWELWNVGNASRCHAWSSSPLYHLSQQILGVVPVEPGWRRVRIDPVPMDLDFARGVVPSPLGPIRVDWEKAEEDQLAVRIDIPAGMTGEFIGPTGQGRALTSGANQFHT